VAGKTGTAQKVDLVAGGYSNDRFVAVFAGFLPAQAPRVVIAVAVDEPKTAHTGGAVAAPVYAEIGEAAMRYLGVVPSDAMRSAPVAAAAVETQAVPPVEVTSTRAEIAVAPHAVPSFVGLTAREAAARFAEIGAGFSLEMDGSGRVVSQEPRAGTGRAGITRVRLVLAQQ
jgi:cell division protein FtsI (penicillin-binding protein 3)